LIARIVAASGQEKFFFENSKMPHVIITFKNIDMEEIGSNRPIIRNVSSVLARLLGNHKDVQGWDFISHKGAVALLIPKRYVILSHGKILSICLLFKDGDYGVED